MRLRLFWTSSATLLLLASAFLLVWPSGPGPAFSVGAEPIETVTVTPGATLQAANYLPLLIHNAQRRDLSPGANLTITIAPSDAITRSASLAPNAGLEYKISLINTGELSITRLPLELAFPSEVFQVRSTGISTDSETGHSAVWTDLTQHFGPLSPNSSQSFTVTLVLHDCPTNVARTLRASTRQARDSQGQPVADAQGDYTDTTRCEHLQLVNPSLTTPSQHIELGTRLSYLMVIKSLSEATPLPRIYGLPVTTHYAPDHLLFERAVFKSGSIETIITPTIGSGVLDFTRELAAYPLVRGVEWNIVIDFKVKGCPNTPGAAFPYNSNVITSIGGWLPDNTYAPFKRHSLPITIICPYLDISMRRTEPEQEYVRRGEPVRFTVYYTATGNQAIDRLPLDNEYDMSALRFIDSDPSISGRGPNGNYLVWDDLLQPRGRALLAGEHDQAWIRFQATGCHTDPVALSRVQVRTEPPRPAVAGGNLYPVSGRLAADAQVKVLCPEISVSLTQVAPSADLLTRELSQVVYRIEVKNVGNMDLVTLPLTMTYQASLFEWVRVEPTPPTGGGTGLLRWEDLLAGGDRRLRPGATYPLTVTLQTYTCPPPQDSTPRLTYVGVTGAVARYTDIAMPVDPDFAYASIRYTCSRLSLEKALMTPGPAGAISPAMPGRDTVTYVITMTNEGSNPITHLPLRDIWDKESLAYVDAYPPPDTDTRIPGEVGWRNLGPLDVMATKTVTITLRAIACPSWHPRLAFNRAVVAGAKYEEPGGPTRTIDDLEESEPVTVACPRLEVQTTLLTIPCEDTWPVVGVNQPVRYSISVENMGNTSLYSIPLTDTFESYFLSIITATAQSYLPPITTGSGVTEATHLHWPNLVNDPALGRGHPLAPRDQYSIIVTFQSRFSTTYRDSLIKQIVNRIAVTQAVDEFGFQARPVTAESRPLSIRQANMFMEVTRDTASPPFRIVQSHTAPRFDNSFVAPGEFITYTVRYGNEGPDPASNVKLSAIFPNALQDIQTDVLYPCQGRHPQAGCTIFGLGPTEVKTFKVWGRIPVLSQNGPRPGDVLTTTFHIDADPNVQAASCSPRDALADNNLVQVVTKVVGEFGDAPLAPIGALPGFGPYVAEAYSGNYLYEWLGVGAGGERRVDDPDDFDGMANVNPLDGLFPFNCDAYDDGIIYRPNLTTGQLVIDGQLTVSVAQPRSARYQLSTRHPLYVTAWIDSNRNGRFGDTSDEVLFRWSGGPGLPISERAIWHPDANQVVIPINVRAPGTPVGWVMIRTRLGYGQPPTPHDVADFGEIEDSLIGIALPGQPIGPPPGPLNPCSR